MGRRKMEADKLLHFSAPVQLMVQIGILGGTATTTELVNTMGVTRSQVSKAAIRARELGLLTWQTNKSPTGRGRRDNRYYVTSAGARHMAEMKFLLERSIVEHNRVSRRIAIAVQ